MKSLIASQSISKVDLALATSSYRSRGLVAKWIKVDGKLICKWYSVQNI